MSARLVRPVFRWFTTPPAAILAAFLGFAGSVQAAAPPGVPPDLSGVWVLADSFMDAHDGKSVAAPGRAGSMSNLPSYMTSQPKMKGDYAKRATEAMMKMMKGLPGADPTADCLPQGVPSFWIGPYAFEILETPKQINLSQEWNSQTRRIYVGGTRPDNVDISYNGHSRARWEGSTLVIVTTDFNTETLLTIAGAQHSEAMRVTEWIRPTGPDLIDVVQVIEDPEALAEPWVRTFPLRRKPGMEMGEYVCAENNRNPVGDDGATKAILQGEER